MTSVQERASIANQAMAMIDFITGTHSTLRGAAGGGIAGDSLACNPQGGDCRACRRSAVLEQRRG